MGAKIQHILLTDSSLARQLISRQGTGKAKHVAVVSDEALVRILSRFLTPATISMEGAHDWYYREYLLPLAAHGDGHVLTVSIALLLAFLTGRSDLCIAGVFGAGKTRSLAVLLIALSCELQDFVAIVYTKENVAAKALADQLSDLAPPYDQELR